jgi:predicted short-subunit dehydrogenase-like oxidoreductase (DUF2520 family)
MIPSLGIVGAGKVGSALARLSAMRGYRVVAVYSRNGAKAAVLAEQVRARVASSPADVVAMADLTLLTVADDALEKVLSTEFRVLSKTDSVLDSALGTQHSVLPPKAVIHTSGAHSLAVLAPLAERVMIGSLHPAYPFADIDSAMAGLDGAAYALEADDERLREWLYEWVAALGGHAIDIPRGEKALYHAALVFASNYAVGLYALAERLLVGIGADKQAADAALNALLAGTVRNLTEQGIPDALTGPLVRGDVGTIAAHLAALERADSDAAALYRTLALATLPLAEARGVDGAAMRQMLKDGETEVGR